jgi:hypothetical protein
MSDHIGDGRMQPTQAAKYHNSITGTPRFGVVGDAPPLL